MNRLRRELTRILEDRRGSVVLVPVFLVLSVVLIGTLVAALITTQSVATSSITRQQLDAVARGAVVAMESELNTKPLPDIQAAAAASYVPDAWVPRDGETVTVTAVTVATPDVLEVTFQVNISAREREPRAFTVEYHSYPAVTSEGEWVRADAEVVPERTLWVAERTVTGADR